MKTLLPIFVAAWAVALAVPLGAQWLNYPSPGLPRTADGKPNLSAPAPRLADGTPDLSGVWDGDHKPPCPPNGCDDNQTVREFLDIGASLKEGLPYRPGMAELAKARRAPPPSPGVCQLALWNGTHTVRSGRSFNSLDCF